jgi:hypothetical protein
MRKMRKEMRRRSRVDARPTSASQENRKELFYDASLLLDVKKAGSCIDFVLIFNKVCIFVYFMLSNVFH